MYCKFHAWTIGLIAHGVGLEANTALSCASHWSLDPPLTQ